MTVPMLLDNTMLPALQFGHSVAAVDDGQPGRGGGLPLSASIRPQRRRRG